MTPRPQTERILAVLADNEWHSFDEIKAAVGAPFSMLERLGELRRDGHWIVRRKQRYKLISSPQSPTRPAASSPPSARRATPFLCRVDESAGQDPDFWTQNTEWSKRVSGAPVAERPTRPDVEVGQ